MHDIATEMAALDRMSTGDLAGRYEELHGQPCRTRHKAYLNPPAVAPADLTRHRVPLAGFQSVGHDVCSSRRTVQELNRLSRKT